MYNNRVLGTAKCALFVVHEVSSFQAVQSDYGVVSTATQR